MTVKELLDGFKDKNYDDLYKVEIHESDGSYAIFNLNLDEIYSEYKFEKVKSWKFRKECWSEYIEIVIELECDE